LDITAVFVLNPIVENIVMQTFRCFVRERRPEKAFDAVCIDLNLVDRRESADEAIAAMIENIESYLETAYEHNDADKLIPRPAPLADQLYYRWLLIKSFFASSRQALSTRLFSVPAKKERILYVKPPLSPAHA
jgi:hypothetical protein